MRLHELDLLLEGQNYDQMFAAIRSLMATMPAEQCPKASTIDTKIAEARRTLKRNDAIVWFLRLYRIEYLAAWINIGFMKTRESIKAVDNLRLQYISEYSRRSGMAPSAVTAMIDATGGIARLLPKIEHFFSLPIAAIQNYRFAYNDPRVVIGEFAEFEKAWQTENSGSFAASQVKDAKLLIDFHSGFAWYLLNQAYCPLEADAMGHCGNGPRSGSSDRIISLRQSIKKGGQVFFKPYLTFILLENGMLGEMKGRFNESPKHAFANGYAPSDFHQEIAALLRLPLIKGITGGGYMPSENFKLSDLPPALAEELAMSKPTLLTPVEEYRLRGMSAELAKRIESAADEAGQKITYNAEQKGFEVESFSNLAEFAKDYVRVPHRRSEPVICWAFKVLDGSEHFEVYDAATASAKEDILSKLARSNPADYKALKDHVTALWKAENSDDDDDEADDDDLPSLEDMIEESAPDIDVVLDSACNAAAERGAENEISEYTDRWLNEIRAIGGDFWIDAPEYDSPVKLMLSEAKTIEWLEEDFEQSLGDFVEVDDISEPSYGFSGFDVEAGVEYFLDDVDLNTGKDQDEAPELADAAD